jgi:hypothetical protein
VSKVWEEEWRAGNPSGSERGELFDAEGENLGSFNTLPSRDYDDSEEAYARARLAAQAPAMARLLQEWIGEREQTADLVLRTHEALCAAGVLDNTRATSKE